MPTLTVQPKPFKVEITGFSHTNKWYRDQIGKTFTVIDYLGEYLLHDDYKARDFIYHFIDVKDCKKL